MKSHDQDNSFWENGRQTFLDYLLIEEAEILAPLKKELKTVTSPILKAEIQKQIKAVKREYKRKRKASEFSLFISPES